MYNFYNKKCSYCKEKFEDESDVVVCPKCGNPYHKSCYEKIGHCNHIKDEDENEEQTKKESISTKTCPKCGHENSENAIFCEKCGNEFFYFNENNRKNSQNGYPNISPPFIFDPLNEIDKNGSIEDVKVKDISEYVQTNVPYYLFTFNRLSKFKQNKFNFSAFLFTGGWLLYRKNYILGSIITFIVAISSIVSTYISYFYYNDILNELSSTLGINLLSVSSRIQPNQLFDAVYQLEPIKIFLLVLPMILEILRWGIMIFIGFNANKIYLKQVTTQIKKIKKASKSEQNYIDNLKDKGGVNTPLAICLMVCYLILNLLPQFLIM